jgi:arylsulfatase A-like enzyme
MFTGLYPITHGVNRLSKLDESITTLAEVLKAEGYHTLGFVRHCGQLCPEFGFARGFDVYIEKKYRDFIAELQNKFMAKYLKKNKDEKLFVFVHYYDVHSDFKRLPYDSPPPYNRMYYPDYAGDFTGGDGELFASEYLLDLNKNKVRLKQDDLKYITALYDGGVTYTDKYIGELFEILKELELYDKSLIIVTSDHGEEFQEHGGLLHLNPYYYEELVHVPLIIKLPWAATDGKVIRKFVESIDFMPTILGTLGVKNVPKMQGENFMKIIENPDAEWKNSVFGYSVVKGPRAFVRNSRWKLVAADISKEDKFKVFDLSKDPGEEFDIIGNPQDVTDQLKNELLGRYVKIERLGSQQKVSATPEQLEILKSLGYVE